MSEDIRFYSGFGQVLRHSRTCLIGHNRAATAGSIIDKNAHPFSFGDITLVHNGTLTSTLNLSHTHDVDSAQIALELTTEEPIDVLEKLTGAFALIWFNTAENTINVARNCQRTLASAVSAAGTYYFASEKKMLEWILDRNHIKVEDWHDVAPGTWYSKELTANSNWVTEEFKPKASYDNYNNWNNTNYNAGYSNMYLDTELNKLGYNYADDIIFEATEWVQNGVTTGNGYCYGTSVGDKPVRCRAFMFSSEYEEGAFYSMTASSVEKANGVPTIHGFSIKRTRKSNVITLPPPEDLKGEVEIFEGHFIPYNEYLKQTSHGCCYCQTLFTAQEIKEHDMEWFDVDAPVHKNCWGDTQ